MRIKRFLSLLSGFHSWLWRRISNIRAWRYGANSKYTKVKESEIQPDRKDIDEGGPVGYLNLVNITVCVLNYRTQSKKFYYFYRFWELFFSIVMPQHGI